MRRKDKEMADMAEIHGLLEKARVCRIAMIDGDRPYVVPMCFAHRKNALYLHSALKGKKIKALKANPHICFEVDTLIETVASEVPCNWSMRYQSVIGFGTAVFLDDVEEKQESLDIIFKRYANRYEPLACDFVRNTAVIRVDIRSMTGKASGI